MTQVLGFIPDGYTRSGTLEGEDRLFPDVKLEYRPMTTLERRETDDKIEDASSRKAEEFAAEAMVAHTVRWDLKDQNGKVVSITKENMLRLHPVLSARLFSVIRGFVALKDDEPPAETEETDQKN